ncbi:adenine deaminase C-terminal domain-containing protein [Virgibacillus sp. W0181]|uniref:adenine deaminase C-terminal domain-containing protein n=1 Tax=Virgibacillus sp. W0181 TaxID=3391581 RepID=UPI003F460674
MLEQGLYWRNRELREHVAVMDGKKYPTLILKNATYLNIFTKEWLQGNIWIYNDRIVYVGERMAETDSTTEVMDLTGQYVVPGYVEPHAHPFQLYNPEQLAIHAAQFGTTTLVNDSMRWYTLLDKKKAFTLLEDFNNLPISMYWWARYDSQTPMQREEEIFNTKDVMDWVANEFVVQGGELSSWPSLLDGDDRLLYWIQETKKQRKPIEGHLPGASEATLTKLKLLGITADHEAMSGSDVIDRLRLGYQVGLRHSSIRPDLAKLLDEIVSPDFQAYDQLTMTTDGSTPSFYEKGMMNVCIDIAIQSGVPLEEAYRMATYNAAKHFGLHESIGSIAPGRIAHLNILYEKDDPHPLSVLAKGQWIIKDGIEQHVKQTINWKNYAIESLSFDWEMGIGDLQFSTPIGLKLVNDVIMKPYPVEIDITVDELPDNSHEAFLLLIDRYGKWRVNSVIKGFTHTLGALASSYSSTGDLVFIGKNKQDILIAWKRLKEIGGGIVLVHEGKVIFELILELSGVMHDGDFKKLITEEKKLKHILQDYGYLYNDPVYNILFLSSTHLPYIRITQQGIYDVLRRETIFPANMR